MVSLRNLLKGSSSPDLWESAKLSVIEDVHITTEELGHGSFGVVYDAVYGGRRCVAKEIYPGLIEKGKSNYKSFIKEINILSTLRHPNIVYFLGVYFRQGSNVPVLITERMWMNLTNLLEKKSFIPHIIKVRILYDVACGLKFLHSQNPPVVHRSLNANNILLNKNIDAKLSDLGSARALETLNMQPMTTPLSNLDYVMPPEALNHDRMYTTKSDVFSFGCVLLHTLAQQLPLPSEQFQESQINKDLFIKVSEYERRSKYVEMIKDQCTHLINLLSICLKDKPVDRPDADKVCKLIEDYWNELKVKPDFSQLVIDYFQQDKISLVTSLDNQCTKAKELQSVVVKLEKSILSKDENNLSLKEYIDDLKGTIQHKEDMYFNMKKKVVYWEDQVTKEKAKLEFGDSFIIDDSSVDISSEILGSGSYSMIYAAQYHGKECAAKTVRSRSDESFLRSFREECKLLVTLRHPCIIQLVGIFFKKDDPISPVILMERMWLSLTEFLASKRYFQDKVTILHDVACGLCYIHSKNIIHCNLTGENILLTSNINARIADFGQAVICDPNSKDSLPTNPGDVNHMPPEASQHNPTYSTKLDIFSFGCVVIHTVTQEFPVVDGRSVLIKKLRPVYVQLHKIVIECLQDHPDKRPTSTSLHSQLKNCTEKHSEVDIHEHSKASLKGSTSIIQKRIKHSRSLYGQRQKSYKSKYNGYSPKRRDSRSPIEHSRLISTGSANIKVQKSISPSNTFASVQPAYIKKPEMDDINKIVVPRINAEWEDVAYALKYTIGHVKAIKAKCGQDHIQCCKELFKDWLSTDKGLKPKTWSTLLQKLGEISDIAAATEEIKVEIASQV